MKRGKPALPPVAPSLAAPAKRRGRPPKIAAAPVAKRRGRPPGSAVGRKLLPLFSTPTPPAAPAKRGRKPDPALRLRKGADALARRLVGTDARRAAADAIVELARAHAESSLAAFVSVVEKGLREK